MISLYGHKVVLNEDFSGELVFANFGLSTESLAQAEPQAYLIKEEGVKEHLPKIRRDQHKYERGYVLAFAGSSSMAGAAILSSFATLRAGAGMVHLFHLNEIEIGDSHPEIIHEKIDLKHKEKALEELKRAKATLIGPGLGRTKEAEQLITYLLETITLPTVIDADALYVLANNPALTFPKNAVLTPHHKELERLLGKTLTDPIQKLNAAQEYADKKNVTLVLKGAPTFVFQPKNPPLIIPRGDPGMATAGSGDVLTGVIAAFLAHGLEPFIAASLGVYIHAIAGEIAAKQKSSYCVVASDISEALPEAFKQILSRN